jgi:predicted aspartyl protease
LSVKERIILDIKIDEKGNKLPFVSTTIDGRESIFLLDTGAVSSSIEVNDWTKKYNAISANESGAAGGTVRQSDVIKVGTIKIGCHELIGRNLSRGGRSLLGTDLLPKIFEIDYQSNSINYLTNFGGTKLDLRRLKTGHFAIPLKVGHTSVFALFDTGADSTILDERFINEHTELFDHVRAETGTDAHGNKIQSDVFSSELVEAGNLALNAVEFATFEFGAHMRKSMEGIPIILGNNVIEKAKWQFDLNNNWWSNEQYC